MGIPPPPSIFGIFDLAKNCDLIQGAQSFAGKILGTKDLRKLCQEQVRVGWGDDGGEGLWKARTDVTIGYFSDVEISACELRSPATAFGRVELFSFFRFITRPPRQARGRLSKGRSSTALPSSDVATSDAETVEEPGFGPA